MAIFNTKEKVAIVALGALLGGLLAGGTSWQSSQKSQLAKLRPAASAAAGAPERAQRLQDIKRAKQLKKMVARRSEIIKTVKKYLPESQSEAISNDELGGVLPTSAQIIESDKGNVLDLSWQGQKSAPAPANQEEGGEAPPPPAAIKFKEWEMSLSLLADYGSWVEYLANIEQLRRFYRIKEVSIKSSNPSHPTTGTPLKIDVKIGTYFGVVFPEENKEEPAPGQ